MRKFIKQLAVASLAFVAGVSLASWPRVHRLRTIEGAGIRPDLKLDQLPVLRNDIAPISYPKFSSIRAVDFSNLTYPGSAFGNYEDYYPAQTFKLRGGKFGDWRYGLTLEKTLYADVTGDGEEDAIINFREETDGSAGQNCVYVFTIENRRLKALWSFESGDRAEGGLRSVYAEDGELVLELFGKETSVDNLNSAEPTALCCPASFTRTRYQWREGEFQRQGEMEVFPNLRAGR
ncbi:MAG TPA: hypothetical protein VGC89_01475 [Pyrinomonadaceae bacterium]